MTEQEYYGTRLSNLTAAKKQLLDLAALCPIPILYSTGRIKSPDSMIRKLSSRGLPTHCDSALTNVNDAVGVRFICSFFDDVYQTARWISNCPQLSVRQTKDYISCPKPNGYRSYHLILDILSGPGAGFSAEIQLRTIAIDFWSSLEHQMKYKRQIRHEELIRSELKRCADEIASIDLSMQTIRDLLSEDF